jgi:hypothetical protein
MEALAPIATSVFPREFFDDLVAASRSCTGLVVTGGAQVHDEISISPKATQARWPGQARQ